jgi:hypothetical protein
VGGVIVHQAFRLETLDGGPEPVGGLSPAEERYAARAGFSRGSRVARRLAKRLVLEWLGRELDPSLLEILPLGATEERDAPSGPPELRLPAGQVPDGLRVHVSLSHCRSAVAALLVVERVG